MQLPEPLTRQVGPLPVWGWIVAGVGGFLAYRFLTGGGNSDGTVTVGDLNGGALGDAFDGGEGGGGGDTSGGDGVSHDPIPVPGTPGGNGTSRMILTVNGRLPFQLPGQLNSGGPEGHIPADAGKFYVEHVKRGGDWYYRIIGRIGPGGVLQHSNRTGQLIRDRAELRKLFTITRTPATQAA